MLFLAPRAQPVLAALVPVVLDGSLPTDPGARATAVQDVAEAFDRAIAGMPPAVQGEIAELFALLANPFTRWAVGGLASDWPNASPAEVIAFLDRWRYSRFDLLRSGYQALTQLINAAWYGNPLAWGQLSYIPPQFA
jgi:hypothetical protein